MSKRVLSYFCHLAAGKMGKKNMEELTKKPAPQPEKSFPKPPFWQNPKIPIVAALVVLALAILGVSIVFYLKTIAPIPSATSFPSPTPISKSEVTVNTDKTEYEQEEIVKIVVKNNSAEVKCISPDFEIENFRIKWEKIRKVWCPCEAICSLQQCKNLQLGEIKEFSWSQKESWCGGLQGHSETISQQVPGGIYRIKIQANGETIYSNEFRIKEKSEDEKSCDEKCKNLGYLSGACRKYAISPQGMAEKCQVGEVVEKGAVDCKLPPMVVGVGISCCCVKK